jgi:hypothetical protein
MKFLELFLHYKLFTRNFRVYFIFFISVGDGGMNSRELEVQHVNFRTSLGQF